MKLIASTYCPQGDVSKFIHSRNEIAEVISFDMFDTEVRTNAIDRIIVEMASGPTPAFHEEIEKFYLEEGSESMLRAVITSSGNILVTGSAVDDDGDILIIFGCDSTRGRVHQDFPNLKEIFPSEIDWDFYASSGPMWYSNDSTIQKLSDWEAKGYNAEDLDFYPEYSILPWEDHADFLIRTREINNSEYTNEVTDALNALALTDYHSPSELVRTVKDGTFYNGNLKGYQRKLLNLHFAGNVERTESAIRYVKAISEIELAERFNLFA